MTSFTAASPNSCLKRKPADPLMRIRSMHAEGARRAQTVNMVWPGKHRLVRWLRWTYRISSKMP